MEEQPTTYAMERTTDELLILFPEDYDLWKDSGQWHITPIDSDVSSFAHPSQSEKSPRLYLIAFLVDYQANGNYMYNVFDVI